MTSPKQSKRDFLKFMGLSSAAMLGAGTIAACTRKKTDDIKRADGKQTSGIGSKPLRIGYLPLTDAAPLLIAHAKGYYEDEGLTVDNPYRFRGWSQISEAFMARQVDVAHLLMPTALWMRYARDIPVSVVAWNHTDGSALAVQKDIDSVKDLGGKTVAIPFWYSVHNVILQQLLRENGLKPAEHNRDKIANDEVRIIILPPSDMPASLANGSIAGYLVAEPFCSLAEVRGIGKILRFTGDVWRHGACCVVIMHEDAIAENPEWAQAVLNANVKAQRWMRNNREETAILLSEQGGGYLPQGLEAIQRTIMHYDEAEYVPTGAIQNPDWNLERIDFLPFPFASYTHALVEFLKDTYVEGEQNFVKDLDPEEVHAQLVDDRMVRVAIENEGGLEAFGLPSSYMREEKFSP